MKKLIKRGFAALLALTLALGMSVSAFAIEGTADTKTAVAKKDYQLTNPDTTSPAETFTFTATAKEVTDATNPDGTAVTTEQMPNLTITPVSYAAGAAGSAANSKQDLLVKPDKAFPSVGVYTYTVTETDGKTAGVTYNKEKLELKATVFHDAATDAIKVHYAFRVDANKGADIVNTYSAGSLHVGKHVSGNLGNKEQKFNINVTFTAPVGQTVNSTITYGDKTITPEMMKDGSETVQISLAAEDVMVFNNVPYGVTYKVQEDKYEGYKTTYSNTEEGADYVEGTINARFTVADIFNEKTGSVDTGVILHSAPYVLLLVGVGAAAVAFLILKKHREV